MERWWNNTDRGKDKFFHGATAPSGPRRPHYRSFTVTHTHSAGHLWPSDQPDVETSTWQHNSQETYIHAAVWIRTRYPHQASGRRPTPKAERPLGPAGKQKYVYGEKYVPVPSCTDMRRLTTGIRSEKCVVRRFRHSVLTQTKIV
jgi:hypothetical protein